MIDENQLIERRTAPTMSEYQDNSSFGSIPYEKMTHEQRIKKIEAQQKLNNSQNSADNDVNMD